MHAVVGETSSRTDTGLGSLSERAFPALSLLPVAAVRPRSRLVYPRSAWLTQQCPDEHGNPDERNPAQKDVQENHTARAAAVPPRGDD